MVATVKKKLQGKGNVPYLCRKSSSFSTQIGKIFKRRMSIGYFSTFQKSVCCIFISVVSLFIVSSPPGIGNIFFWWITLNKVFLRSLCFAEVDNPHSVSSLLLLLHNVFLAYNINKISTACKKDFDVMLDANRQTLYFNFNLFPGVCYSMLGVRKVGSFSNNHNQVSFWCL